MMASWSADKIEIVICPHCHAENKVPIWYRPVDLPVKCSTCHKIFNIDKWKRAVAQERNQEEQ
jgi:hypothetical protein